MKTLLLTIFTLISFGINAQQAVVVLDAGHGGNDKGAENLNQKESDLTLELTQGVAEALAEFPEIKVIQTRISDQFMSLDDRIESIQNANPTLLISFHFNSAENASAKGVSAFVNSSENMNSQTLAYNLIESVKQFGYEDDGVLTSDLKLIKDLNNPAVIFEIGYLSNVEDMQRFHKNKDFMTHAIAKYIILTLSEI